MADYKIRCIDAMIEYGKPDILIMHDDWGMNTNLFFAPETWRKFIKPHEKRFADRLHASGVLYEHHSCGYITLLGGAWLPTAIFTKQRTVDIIFDEIERYGRGFYMLTSS